MATYETKTAAIMVAASKAGSHARLIPGRAVSNAAAAAGLAATAECHEHSSSIAASGVDRRTIPWHSYSILCLQ